MYVGEEEDDGDDDDDGLAHEHSVGERENFHKHILIKSSLSVTLNGKWNWNVELKEIISTFK